MTFTGARLHQGFDVQLQPGVDQRYKIHPLLTSVASDRGPGSTTLSVAHNPQGPVIAPVLPGFPLKGIPARSVSGPSVVLTVSGRAVSRRASATSHAARMSRGAVFVLIPE
jgi:hypothetical protein